MNVAVDGGDAGAGTSMLANPARLAGPGRGLTDVTAANGIAPSAGVTADVAVVGEGVREVDGTAILESVSRLATFSRLSESVLNPLFSPSESRDAFLVGLPKPGTNEKLHAGGLLLAIVYW